MQYEMQNFVKMTKVKSNVGPNQRKVKMKITRTSRFTGNTNVMELPITQSQLDAWVDGELIQNVMPHLSVDEREFIISGVTPAEWNSMFGEEV